jgi:hypothetical protein
MSRYVVATVTGYPFHMPMTAGGSSSREGLSAHVCDTVYLHEVVASYRSTDFAPHVPGGKKNQRIGKEGALALAEAHAARLNDGS